MGLENMTLLSQAAGYTVSVILSLCVVTPMVFHLVNFKGHCLLYTSGTFIAEDGRFDPSWASPFFCGFTLFVGFLLLFASLVQLTRMGIFLYKRLDRLVC